MRLSVLSAVAGIAILPAIAVAQWTENFDTYTAGSINGQGPSGGPNASGPWQGWQQLASAAGTVVTSPVLSAPNSQQITVGDDSVQKYTGVTAGAWTYSTNIFIPTGTTGNTYFILLNRYADPSGPFNWSVELLFNLTTNLVFDDLANVGSPSPGSASVPIVRGQWTPISVSFDLGADTFSASYNNTLVMAGAWKRGSATGAAALAAVDLYHDSGTGSVYYDNFNLVPAPASAMLLGLAGLLGARRRRA